jgi:hypothetical protein
MSPTAIFPLTTFPPFFVFERSIDVVNLEFGCAADDFPFHSLPCQSHSFSGGSSIPSHHGVPIFVMATFVNIVFFLIVFMMFGFVFLLVFGATPKKPVSGLREGARFQAADINQ